MMSNGVYILKLLIKGLIILIKFLICAYCFYLAWKFAWLNCNEQFIAFLVVGFAFVFILFAKELTPFFENISIFGLNIKLRKVETLVQDLTNLLVAVAGISLENTLAPLTEEKTTYESMESSYNRITNLLKKYNLDSKKIKDIQEKYWHEKIYRVYTKKIFESADVININKEYYNKWHNAFEPFILPDKIRTIIKNPDDISEKYILDYEYYYKNKTQRSLTDWNKLLKCGTNYIYWANTDKNKE